MDKSAESQKDHSAGQVGSNQNSHLSDEQLLFDLDGELSACESEQVKDHLEACWACRSRSKRIGEIIADVVRYRDQLEKSFLPLSADGRAIFTARLRQLVWSAGQLPLRSRVMGALRACQACLQRVAPPPVWITGLLILSVVLWSARLWTPLKVSAGQVLENAQVSELHALRGVAKPVVYQRLRIRIGSQTVTRTIYRDPVGMRRADHIELAGSGEDLTKKGDVPSKRARRPNSTDRVDEIKQTFLTAHLNWQDPLSPTSYKEWRNSLRDKRDVVSAIGNNLLTITTTTTEGPVMEARLTLRALDFHPTAEELRLRDTREVEVDELAWEVLPMEAISATIFQPESIEPSFEAAHAAKPTSPPLSPTDAELAESELRARVAIHAEGADLGEQIELNRNTPRSELSNGQRSVVVQGIISTLERRKSLVAALQGIPHLELHLQTVGEVAAQQDQVNVDKSDDAKLQVPQEAVVQENRVTTMNVEGGPPAASAGAGSGMRLIERQLEVRYPKREDRTAFVNRTLGLVQDAAERVWALRRLRDSYPPRELAELNRGSQQTLALLIRDHVSVLREDVDAMRNTVLPLVLPESLMQVPSPNMPDASPPEVATAGDWRTSVTEIFPEVQKMNENVATLLAGADNGPAETQALIRDLQLAVGKLEAQLPLLYKQAGEPITYEQ